VYIQLGRYALQAEKYDDAIQSWQQAKKIDPHTPFVLQNIGNALLNLGRTEDAVAVLKQEIEIAPLASQTHFLLGEAFFQLRDFAQAKSSYQRAVELQPNHTKAVYGLVKVCARLGEREEAAVYSEEFQRLEAATAQSDQEYRRRYDDLQQMKDRLAETCTDAGRVYFRHKNPRQAERLWLRAAEVDSHNAACRVLLASLYTRERKAVDALRQYRELLRIEPDNVEHLQKIGFLQARLGNLAEAESAFRQMVEVAPRNAAGHRALAKFYLNTDRQPALAQKLADKAVELDPVADSYFVLGWASAKNGKRQQAVAALQKAIRLNPDNATYRELYEAVRRKENK
jgi:tetratricopeptide (TPR) repeat protein